MAAYHIGKHCARLVSQCFGVQHGQLRVTSALRALHGPVNGAPVENKHVSQYVLKLMQQYQSLINRAKLGSENDLPSVHQSISALEPIVKLVRSIENKTSELAELTGMLEEGEAEFKDMVQLEIQNCERELDSVRYLLVEAVLPKDKVDSAGAIIELRAGAGGDEASLFTADVFQMYQRFAGFKGWSFEQLSMDHSDSGGLKHVAASVNGSGVYGTLKHEIGVHRVQRVPVTEGAGRVHTSTMSVVILPQPTKIEVKINANDLKIDTMRASGAGGQHVNTTDSAIRLTHLPTGIVINIQDERSQHKNRAKAIKILEARLYEQERLAVLNERSQQRKQQMGNQDRSQKIRTYNFPQDRITDHRLGQSFHGIREFLSGGSQLGSVIDGLRLREREELLESLID